MLQLGCEFLLLVLAYPISLHAPKLGFRMVNSSCQACTCAGVCKQACFWLSCLLPAQGKRVDFHSLFCAYCRPLSFPNTEGVSNPLVRKLNGSCCWASMMQVTGERTAATLHVCAGRASQSGPHGRANAPLPQQGW